MNSLIFIPVMRQPTLPEKESPPITRLDPASSKLDLFAAGEGECLCLSVTASADAARARKHDSPALASLHSSQGDEPAWYLVPRTGQLRVNGQQPLGLAAISAGDLISVGQNYWLVTRLWSPQRVNAPPELSGKPCPVCSGPLGQPGVQVVQCACGRWMHLERPERPGDPDALNCFLTCQVCGGCNQPTSLAARLIPQPSEKLCDEHQAESAASGHSDHR